jgi:hypothetical protein
MQKKTIRLVALAFLAGVVFFRATGHARAQAEKAPDPAMSP